MAGSLSYYPPHHEVSEAATGQTTTTSGRAQKVATGSGGKAKHRPQSHTWKYSPLVNLCYRSGRVRCRLSPLVRWRWPSHRHGRVWHRRVALDGGRNDATKSGPVQRHFRNGAVPDPVQLTPNEPLYFLHSLVLLVVHPPHAFELPHVWHILRQGFRFGPRKVIHDQDDVTLVLYISHDFL